MNGIIFLNVSGGLYTLLTAFSFFSKKRVTSNETKTYGLLLLVTFLELILGMISSVAIYQEMNEYFISIVGRLYSFSMLAWTAVFCLYVVSISISLKDKYKKALKQSIFFLMLISLIFILVLPLDFRFENNVIFSEGLALDMIYLLSAIYILIIVVSGIRNIKNFNKRYVPLWIFVIAGTIVMIIQMFYPELFLVVPFEVFVSSVMYHTIENPDVKMIEQLELARDAADKANAAKTDFLSSMSHEIRTPLNAIVGFSDCIKHSDNLDEAKENADDIINASNTLLEIVNGILDISKIEAGKLEIVNSDYNAPKLFNGLAKLISPKMREKGLDFQVVIAEDLPPTLYGDPANVKKVVTNLLSNAYKYTDKGYVRFEVKCVNNDGICRLIISVEDSGRGIKKESIDKLFTKFQRVEEDKNTTIEGTGLGLAITKQLVELMGGNVVVSSVYGEGSKFIITLDQRIDNVVVEEEKEVADTIDLTGKKLLIVDDNMVNLKVASKLFARYNAEVEVCDSGFKCIELIEKGNRYDLILMDDMMPKMSGTETFKKLKSSSRFNIPVVALTANAITGMKEKYLGEGFTDYLAKPIEKEAMIESFNKIFNSGVVLKTIETVEEINLNKDFLDANGVDVNHGLELLGDISLYNDTMSDFLDEIDKRLPLLSEYKNNSDMENYAIIVHAIKSDCKYLGIMTLADLAYEHELKSKANDVEYVNNNYDNLVNMIGDYVTICKKYLGRD